MRIEVDMYIYNEGNVKLVYINMSSETFQQSKINYEKQFNSPKLFVKNGNSQDLF